jgi:hypothetical protein
MSRLRISTLFTDGIDGSLSSRRVITLTAFALCVVAYVCDMLRVASVAKDLYDSMMYIVVAGLTATVTEKFTGRDSYYNSPHAATTVDRAPSFFDISPLPPLGDPPQSPATQTRISKATPLPVDNN